MARYGRDRYQGRSTYGSRSPGLEAALQHIEDAKQLSAELGGTDEDVKAYFFGLPPQRLRLVLDKYEREFGAKVREYAEATIPKWKTGRVKMSGLVAGRLYSLLPPLMPLTDKYALVRSLWKHICPSTHKVLWVGAEADQTKIVEVVRDYVANTVQDYFIHQDLKNRFRWLSGGDVHVQEQLLNHLLESERKAAIGALHVQLPVLLGHMQKHGAVTKRLRQAIEIGKHRIDLEFQPSGSDVRLEEPRLFDSSSSAGPSSGPKLSWLWWLIGIGILIWIIAAR